MLPKRNALLMWEQGKLNASYNHTSHFNGIMSRCLCMRNDFSIDLMMYL